MRLYWREGLRILSLKCCITTKNITPKLINCAHPLHKTNYLSSPHNVLSQSSKFIDIDTIRSSLLCVLTLYRWFPVILYLQARWPSRSFVNSQQPPWMITWTSWKNPHQFTEKGTATKPGYIRESLLIKSCKRCERGKHHRKSSTGFKRVLQCHRFVFFLFFFFLALKSNRS